MKTKTIELYEYSELSKEAQQKALLKWVENNDYYFLSDILNERLHEILEANGIIDTNDTSQPGTTPTQVLYSLSCCQGDGAMFEGKFIFQSELSKVDGQWKKYTVTVKHAGQYYHYNSKSFSIYENDEQDEVHDEAVRAEFNDIYVKICKELEKDGYEFIEYEDSEENFIEACEANEYTFTKDGKMENE